MSNPNRLKYIALRKFSRSHSRYYALRLAGFCIVLFALSAHLSHASEWDQIDNTTDGIQIFRKVIDGSRLVAFRGNGVVDAPLPLVATAILDTNRRREWIEGLVDSKIIRWGGDHDFIEYDHIGMPFFFKDRDFVSKIRMNFESSKKEMAFHYQPSDDPSVPHTHYIRGELLSMTFVLSAIDNDRKTRVDAEFLCDPKGWIPKWLVNYALRDWPKTTFRNLRKEVQKSDLSVDPRFTKLLQR